MKSLKKHLDCSWLESNISSQQSRRRYISDLNKLNAAESHIHTFHMCLIDWSIFISVFMLKNVKSVSWTDYSGEAEAVTRWWYQALTHACMTNMDRIQYTVYIYNTVYTVYFIVGKVFLSPSKHSSLILHVLFHYICLTAVVTSYFTHFKYNTCDHLMKHYYHCYWLKYQEKGKITPASLFHKSFQFKP